jgi:putative membrane protein
MSPGRPVCGWRYDRAMKIAADVVVAAVALLHAYILVLEMFLWTTPRGRRAFGTSVEFAESSASLAANQGLYNGFLAAGLVWGLIASDPTGFAAKVFFLSCVVVAGVYGAVTVNRRILFVQSVPAAIGLALVLLAR